MDEIAFVCVYVVVDLGERPGVLLIMSSSGLHTTESFDIVLRGNGFTLGRQTEGVVCSFIVDGVTFRKYDKTTYIALSLTLKLDMIFHR